MIVVESFEDIPLLKTLKECPKCKRTLKTLFADVMSPLNKKIITVKVKGCRKCKQCFSGREGFVTINKHTAVGNA